MSDGDLAFNRLPIGTWAVTALMDDPDSPFGTYDPGVTGQYGVIGHCLLPDGDYTQRIIGLQGGSQKNQVVHLLQSGAED